MATTKKTAPKKKAVVKKTPLHTEAQWQNKQKQLEEAQKRIKDLEATICTLSDRIAQLKEDSDLLYKAYKYDNEAETLITTLLRSRDPKKRVLMLNRIASIIRFGLEENKAALLAKTNEQRQEANETWQRHDNVQEALCSLGKIL